MELHKIIVNQCYRTKSGEICKVTGITDTNAVLFIPYVTEMPGEIEELPATLFADNVVEEVDCPRTG